MKRSPWLLLALLLSGPALRGEEAVNVGFAWPLPLTLSVSVERSKKTDLSSSTLGYSFKMRAYRDEEGGIVIENGGFSDFTVNGKPFSSEGTARDPALAGTLILFQPSVRLGPDGKFVGILDPEGLIAALGEDLGTMDLAELRKQIDKGLGEGVARAAYERRIRDEWFLLIGSWVGSSLVPDEVYELEEEGPSAVLPDLSLPILERFQLEETRVPGLVILSFESYPDPEKTKEAVKRLLESQGAALGDLSIESLSIERRVTLVAEASTLLPSSFRFESLIRFKVASGAASEQSETVKYRFTLD